MTEIPKDKISCKICKYHGESPISGTCEGCNYFSKFEIDYDKVCKWCYNPVAEGDNICALCDFSFMPSQCDIYKKYGCQSNHCYKLVKEDNTIMDKKRKCPRCGSESCEPLAKKSSGNFVEYDIDENGCYHPLNDRGSSSNCRWQDIHHYEDVNRIFAGWLWVHPDKPRNNCWSTSRMGIWNNELTTASHTWEYPLAPTKIRFWVKY